MKRASPLPGEVRQSPVMLNNAQGWRARRVAQLRPPPFARVRAASPRVIDYTPSRRRLALLAVGGGSASRQCRGAGRGGSGVVGQHRSFDQPRNRGFNWPKRLAAPFAAAIH